MESDSTVLLDTGDYGSRKLLQVTGLPKAPVNLPNLPSLPNLPRPSSHSRSSERSGGKGKFLPYSHSDSNLQHYLDKEESEGSADLRALSRDVMKSSTKQWLHPADLLLKGHIVYNVKFYGEVGVDQPKGTEVVKDAIRKMKFNRQLKRSEGQKPPKVQLTISADGVGVQDPKTKMILHQYPLHRISYCADDKSDKKMFTFIAKAATTNDHFCYVFSCSDKSAEDITLTVGQAFDLAYKRFLEEGSSVAGADGDTDYKKQCLLLQRRVNSLQFENDALKKRVLELEKLKDRSDLEEYMKNNRSAQQTTQQHSMVGRRLENLVFDSNVTQPNGNSSSAPQSPTPLLSPPPPSTRSHRNLAPGVPSPGQSSHGTAAQPVRQQPASEVPSNPFASPGPAGAAASDPFGMGTFNPAYGATFPTNNAANGAAFGGSSQQELMDIQAGFSRGLSFGTDDFDLGDLDPLNHRL